MFDHFNSTNSGKKIIFLVIKYTPMKLKFCDMRRLEKDLNRFCQKTAYNKQLKENLHSL